MDLVSVLTICDMCTSPDRMCIANMFFSDVFESLSLSVKKERYKAPQDTLRDQDELTGQVEVAEKQMSLYEVYTCIVE